MTIGATTSRKRYRIYHHAVVYGVRYSTPLGVFGPLYAHSAREALNAFPFKPDSEQEYLRAVPEPL